jgi:hypothetical protein
LEDLRKKEETTSTTGRTDKNSKILADGLQRARDPNSTHIIIYSLQASRFAGSIVEYALSALQQATAVAASKAFTECSSRGMYTMF